MQLLSHFGNSVHDGRGLAGIGGVLRDSIGNVLCTFSEKVGYADIIGVEILAIARACKLFESNQVLKEKSLVVVSDSSTTVSWINGSGVGSWDHLNLILDIRNLLGRLSKIRVEFCSRVSNSYADLLAKKGASDVANELVWNC